MKKYRFKFIIFLTLTLIFQGCMPDSLTKFKKEEAKKATKVSAATTTTSIADPPDLTTLDAFELKNITEKSTSYKLHKYGQDNQEEACEISTSDLTNGEDNLTDQENDILCWLEAEEAQLFFNGTDLQLNTPAGQCEYIQVKPYYYWNAPPANTAKKLQAVTCGNSSDAACVAVGGTNDLQPEDTACYADYTSLGGPNCDEGYVQVNNINVTAYVPEVLANASSSPPVAYAAAIPSVTTQTITKTACGGKRTNCYGGPGVDFKVSTNGRPVPVDYLAYTGQSINYSITAPGPLGKGYGSSNHYIANYTQLFAGTTYAYDYTITSSGSSSPTGLGAFSNTSSASSTLTYADLGIDSYDLHSAASSTAVIKDLALDPLKRANATLIRNGTSSWTTGSAVYPVQPYYEFSCLNYAHEVKGRIRLQIREWNQRFRTPVADYSEITESAPARLVKHSANSTDYETSGIGYWNDLANWDFPYSYGSVSGGIPASSSVNATGFLFPYLGFNSSN